MNADSIVRAFIARINAHDADAIAAALTCDHLFIDSLGTRITGREVMREGWRAYLRMVPDYRLSITKVFVDGADVVVTGQAQGTWSVDGSLHAHNAWVTPAAFRAQLRDGLIAEWQVYADNEPIRRRMQQRA
jgi:ketosteroid isomerase-like protein